MSLLCAFAMAALGANPIPPLPADDVAGLELLDQAVAAREQLGPAAVEIEQTWCLPNGSIVRRETGCFNQEALRLDIWALRTREDPGKLGVEDPAWIASIIATADTALMKSQGIGRIDYSMHTVEDCWLELYNPKWLGFPMVHSPYDRGDWLWAGAQIDSVERDGSLVTLRLTRHGETDCASAMIVVDENKRPMITRYQVDYSAWGLNWTILGESIAAQFGNRWFPAYSRVETRRDGELEFYREFVVAGASFQCELDPGTFEWGGLDVPLGGLIVSYVPGRGHLLWDGTKTVAWE